MGVNQAYYSSPYRDMYDKLIFCECSMAVMVVIVWLLDLQLLVQTMPITTNVVSSNPAQARSTPFNIM